MAEGWQFVCDHCGFETVAWSDGNPYIAGPDGKKEYVYHPDHRAALATGVDIPHLCLCCGCHFVVDSNPQCSDSVTDDPEMPTPTDRCPKCKEGTFKVDPGSRMIS